MDIKDYRKAIRELLKESKEKKAALSEGRVITRKLKSGEPSKGGDTALERVSGKTGHTKPEDAEVTPSATVSSYKARRRRGNPSVGIEQQGGKATWREGESTRNQTAIEPRKKPNRHQRKRMKNKAPEENNEARKEAWLNAFESILLEFDPRHDTGRAKEVDATLAAATARETSLKKSRRANNAANKKAKKKGDNLSTPEQRKKWAEKEANRARQRVGGTTGQQHDNTLNPKSPELTRAEIKQRARKQRAKKGRKRMMKEAFSVILERDGLEISGKVHTNDHGVFKGQGQTRGRKRKVVRSRRDADPEVVQGRAFNTKVRIAANQATKNRDTPRRKLP